MEAPFLMMPFICAKTKLFLKTKKKITMYVRLINCFSLPFIISSCLSSSLVKDISGTKNQFDIQNGRQDFLDIYSRHRRSTYMHICQPIIQDKKSFYEIEFVNDLVDQRWVGFKSDSMHLNLSESPGWNVRLNLSFTFPFYGHPTDHVFISTAGMLTMNPDLDHGKPTHFIAPYMSSFNPNMWNQSAIYFKDKGDSLVVEWRNMFQHQHGANAPFRFQTIIYKNGTVLFLYKKLPSNLVLRSSFVGLHGVLKITISGIDTLVFYRGETVDPADIHEGLGLIFTPVFGDVLANDSEKCVSQNISFYCKCCEIAIRCSDKVYGRLQEWINSSCNYGAFANCTDVDHRSSQTPPPTEGTSSNTTIVLVAVAVSLIVLIVTICSWVYYAYRHPLSPSGKWLLEHYPSYLWAKYRARIVESRLKDTTSTSTLGSTSTLAQTDESLVSE